MKTYIENEDSNEIRDFDCKPDPTLPFSQPDGSSWLQASPPSRGGGNSCVNLAMTCVGLPDRALRCASLMSQSLYALKSLVVQSVRTPIDSFSVGVP